MDSRNGFTYGNGWQGQTAQNGNRMPNSGWSAAVGSAQVSNQASNISNFYFVNPGNYNLALGGPGAPGMRHPNDDASNQMMNSPAIFPNGQRPPNPFGSGYNPNSPIPMGNSVQVQQQQITGTPSAFVQLPAPTPVGGGGVQHQPGTHASGSQSFNTSGNSVLANPPSIAGALEPYAGPPVCYARPQFQGYRQYDRSVSTSASTLISEGSRSDSQDENYYDELEYMSEFSPYSTLSSRYH